MALQWYFPSLSISSFHFISAAEDVMMQSLQLLVTSLLEDLTHFFFRLASLDFGVDVMELSAFRCCWYLSYVSYRATVIAQSGSFRLA